MYHACIKVLRKPMGILAQRFTGHQAAADGCQTLVAVGAQNLDRVKHTIHDNNVSSPLFRQDLAQTVHPHGF